jgi:hypothetical protein
MAVAEAPQERFSQAQSAYQEKNYDQAAELFEALVRENPNHPTLLYNLGLTKYQLGQVGMALGLWRKARSLDKSLSLADEAIHFTEEQVFTNKASPNLFATLWANLLVVPRVIWWLLALISFFLLGWYAVEYGVKQALAANMWPSWYFLVTPVFLLSAGISLVASWHSTNTMATVVERDVVSHVTPSEDSPSLASMVEGEVVLVKKSLGGWAQIVSNDGRPGWVKSAQLILFKEN